jgi:hypothetical protein
MYSLNNLLKLNDLKDKHPNFDTLNLEQLRPYLEKYQKLTNDQKLTKSLPDKGEKLRNQLKHIQVNNKFDLNQNHEDNHKN